MADRRYRCPDLAKPIPKLLHGGRATDRDRNADDNGIHLFAAPLEVGVQCTPDRRKHNVVEGGAVAVGDCSDVFDACPGYSEAALCSGWR